jgi:biopolymer transport protein ExbD
MHFRRPAPFKIAIDIAPLVDVVFLLVIFFAASTTFLETSGIQLDLPSSTSTAERETEEITVFLASDGSLEFEGEQVDTSSLGGKLQQALEGQTRRVVVLRADTKTPHGEVVRVMDVIREAGAEALTIAARSPSAN